MISAEQEEPSRVCGVKPSVSHPRGSLMRASIIFALVLLTHAVAICQTAPATITQRVEQAAARLPWLSVSDVLSDRDPFLGPGYAEIAEITRQLFDSVRPPTTARDWQRAQQESEAAIAEVRKLIGHADPKVRSLAILLLFAQNRLDVLPDIAQLVADGAEAFPEPARVSVPADFGPDPWPMERKTVADYAQGAIDRYIDASHELAELRRNGNLELDDPKDLSERLRAFAGARDPRDSTAALRVAMERATGRISPFQFDRGQRVLAVLMRLEHVPKPRRFYVALALELDRFRGEVYPPTYMLELARHVPREMRLATIRGQRGNDDPDLPPDFGWMYFLEHAADLFHDEDFDLLLQLARDKVHPGSYGDPRYFIAAAMLRPDQADAILVPAFTESTEEHLSDQRVRVAVALAELGGEEGIAEAVDWFFREPPQPGAFGFGREAFLNQLLVRSPIRHRRIVAKIVRDQRLTTLGPASTRLLLLSVEGYVGRQLADDEEVRSSLGIDEFQRDRKFEHLGKWQRLLRETVNEWDHP